MRLTTSFFLLAALSCRSLTRAQEYDHDYDGGGYDDALDPVQGGESANQVSHSSPSDVQSSFHLQPELCTRSNPELTLTCSIPTPSSTSQTHTPPPPQLELDQFRSLFPSHLISPSPTHDPKAETHLTGLEEDLSGGGEGEGGLPRRESEFVRGWRDQCGFSFSFGFRLPSRFQAGLAISLSQMIPSTLNLDISNSLRSLQRSRHNPLLPLPQTLPPHQHIHLPPPRLFLHRHPIPNFSTPLFFPLARISRSSYIPRLIARLNFHLNPDLETPSDPTRWEYRDARDEDDIQREREEERWGGKCGQGGGFCWVGGLVERDGV